MTPRTRLSNRAALARAGRTVVSFRGRRQARRAAVIALLWDLAVFGKADLDGDAPPLAVKSVGEWQRIVDAVMNADADGPLAGPTPVVVQVNGVVVDGAPPLPALGLGHAEDDIC